MSTCSRAILEICVQLKDNLIKIPHCKKCGRDGHYQTFCRYTPQKAIKQQSAKEVEYQEWKETFARPHLIARDGNYCSCCHRPAYDGEKLDIEHTRGKGSHTELKRDLSNMTLMCRFPCHRNKTDRIPCYH